MSPNIINAYKLDSVMTRGVHDGSNVLTRVPEFSRRSIPSLPGVSAAALGMTLVSLDSTIGSVDEPKTLADSLAWVPILLAALGGELGAQSGCLTKKASLFVLGDLAEIFDVRVGFYHGPDLFLPISLIDAVHLCRDLQWYAGSHSDFDSAIWPFFWGDATQEGEIAARRLRAKW